MMKWEGRGRKHFIAYCNVIYRVFIGLCEDNLSKIAPLWAENQTRYLINNAQQWQPLNWSVGEWVLCKVKFTLRWCVLKSSSA